MQLHLLFSIVFCLLSTLGLSQANFHDKLAQEDPVSIDEELNPKEKFQLHEKYLKEAIKLNDTLEQILGHIYLYQDQLEEANYEEASSYILEAEEIALAKGNKSWIGWIKLKKGALYVYLRDFNQALEYYHQGLQMCTIAKDSTCMAKNYEQLSSMYGQLKNFDSAHYYYQLAEPLLISHAGEDAYAVALANYGSLLVYQDKNQEALSYLQRASAINEKLSNVYRKVQNDNNLASAYADLQLYDKAESIFKNCIQINKENKWPERLFYNYHGLAKMYKEMGNYREAMDYYVRFQKTREAVINENLRGRIAELETQYELERKNRVLEKSQSDLREAQLSLQRMILLFSLFTLILFGSIYYWVDKARRSKQILLKHQENLKYLTKVLIQKNQQLATLDSEIMTLKSSDDSPPEHVKDNLYNQRILTDDDWMEFKVLFEKSYPGFIEKVCSVYRNITEAELRLFLFIKLKLSSKEAASILGISSDGVKKTRYRLRKRLQLEKTDSLEEFTYQF